MLLWSLLSVAGCATGGMGAPDLPPVTDRVQVMVFGDGFVRTDDRRLPLDSFVLELRQRVRAMDPAQRGGLRIEIDVEPTGGNAARDGAERLVDQLQIMGIRNVSFA